MNLDSAWHLRARLADNDWLTRIRVFGAALRTAGHTPGGLLVVGTPEHEPWHFAAHLDDAARFSDQPHLTPTLLRHHIPVGAPPHLAVDLKRLHTAARGHTVLVAAPTAARDDLLNRIADARQAGAVILTIEAGDADLQSVAHDTLTLTDQELLRCDTDLSVALGSAFDVAEHFVSLVAAESSIRACGSLSRLDRLRRSLDNRQHH